MSRGLERGYFIIEARWEDTRDSPGAASFFEVDQIGGSLDDAKSVAQSYFNRNAALSCHALEWVEGVFQKRRCFYAHSRVLTFRISN